MICQLLVSLASSSHTTEGVEHSGAQEADEGDHEELELGTGIPGDVDGANFAVAVHPAAGEIEAIGRGLNVNFVVLLGVVDGGAWGDGDSALGGHLVVQCGHFWRDLKCDDEVLSVLYTTERMW